MRVQHVSHRVRGSIVAALVVGAVAVGSSAVVASASSPSRVSPRAVPACTASGVVNWLDTQGNGAAGSFNFHLQFTNLSGHKCTITGYPGVSAVNLHSSQVGSPASRSAATYQTVTVGVGATVKAQLQVTDTGVFSPSACRATTAAGLRVFAPNQSASTVIPFPFSTCSKVGTVSLHVGPVTS